MPSKLLVPKPMIAIELCAICGRAHVDPRGYRRCAVCGALFCWQGPPRGENFFGVERRPCGSRAAASRRAYGSAWDSEPHASRAATPRRAAPYERAPARPARGQSQEIGSAENMEPAASHRFPADSGEPAQRIEYRCLRHSGQSWVMFGADWAAIRPIAIYLFLCVAFSVAFWGLVFLLLSAWLRQLGIG